MKQGSRSSPRKTNAKKEMVSEEALQTAEKRREMKGKGEKKKIYPSECIVPKNSKER